MTPHIRLLIRANFKIAERLAATQQNKARLFVFGEVRVGVRFIHPARYQPAGAGKTSALVTNRRKADAATRGSVPDIFIRPAGDYAFSFGCVEDHLKRGRQPKVYGL